MAYRLYSFPASHFCEKARWALDYKGLTYEEIAWVPIFHFFQVRKLKLPQTFVPILVSGTERIQGSNKIISYLETYHPQPGFMPQDREAQRWAEEVDEKLNRLGVHVRRYVYWLLLPNRKAALPAFRTGLQGFARWILPLAYPFVKTGIFKGLNINAESAKRSLERIHQGLAWLEEVRSGRPFLLGDHFTYLDISAASLMAPLCLPSEHPIYSKLKVPREYGEAIAAFRSQPFLKWVGQIYGKHRGKGRPTSP